MDVASSVTALKHIVHLWTKTWLKAQGMTARGRGDQCDNRLIEIRGRMLRIYELYKNQKSKNSSPWFNISTAEREMNLKQCRLLYFYDLFPMHALVFWFLGVISQRFKAICRFSVVPVWYENHLVHAWISVMPVFELTLRYPAQTGPS